MATYSRTVKAGTLESYQDRIRRVVRHIEGRLDEPLRLDELAAIANFSPYHFHRIFRGMTGESVKEHVRRLRLERSAQRLLFCDCTILEIAIEAQYETHESFTRAFDAMFGITPSAFRKQGGIGMNPTMKDPGALPAVDVSIRRIDPMHVAFVRHVGPYMDVGSAFDKLGQWAGMNGLFGPNSVMLGIPHDDPDVTPADKLRYDAALTVAPGTPGSGEVATMTVGGGEYAVAVHKGPYENLSNTYRSLYGGWLPTSGRELRDAPPLEIYRNMPGQVPPEELLTDVCVPLK